MKEYNFLAFDIGATSGRAVLGTLKDAKFEMKEIHRFPNPMVELHGRFYWDIYHLYTSLIELDDMRPAKNPVALDRNRYMGSGFWVCGFGWLSIGLTSCLPRSLYGRRSRGLFQTDSQGRGL